MGRKSDPVRKAFMSIWNEVVDLSPENSGDRIIWMIAGQKYQLVHGKFGAPISAWNDARVQFKRKRYKAVVEQMIDEGFVEDRDKRILALASIPALGHKNVAHEAWEHFKAAIGHEVSQ